MERRLRLRSDYQLQGGFASWWEYGFEEESMLHPGLLHVEVHGSGTRGQAEQWVRAQRATQVGATVRTPYCRVMV